MTEAEYLDPKRFPLSNRQSGLTLKEQKMLDAINYDDLRELLERGETLNPAQQAVRLELEEKVGRKLEPPDSRSELEKLLGH